MKTIKKLIISILLISIYIPFSIFAEDEGRYIEETFKSQISEIPKMAWLIPPDVIITEEKSPSIYLYTDAKEILKAGYVKAFNRTEIAKIRKKYGVACEEYEGERSNVTYHRYRLSRKLDKEFGYPDRVFYTSKPLSGAAKAGYKFGLLDKKGIEGVLKLINFGGRAYLHKHFTVSLPRAKHMYSFHGFYDKESKEIFKEAMILHDADGKVLARKLWDISEDTLCDGCPHPVYHNENPEAPAADMTESFRLLNAFSLPNFSYPVLMLETSTVEGRAISFVTFEPKGLYSEYRIYEYIVNCLPEN